MRYAVKSREGIRGIPVLESRLSLCGLFLGLIANKNRIFFVKDEEVHIPPFCSNETEILSSISRLKLPPAKDGKWMKLSSDGQSIVPLDKNDFLEYRYSLLPGIFIDDLEETEHGISNLYYAETSTDINIVNLVNFCKKYGVGPSTTLNNAFGTRLLLKMLITDTEGEVPTRWISQGGVVLPPSTPKEKEKFRDIYNLVKDKMKRNVPESGNVRLSEVLEELDDLVEKGVTAVVEPDVNVFVGIILDMVIDGEDKSIMIVVPEGVDIVRLKHMLKIKKSKINVIYEGAVG